MVLRPLLARESELARLEGAWSAALDGNPQLVVLWGRRRVGKTFLLSHFVQGKRAVFFGATQQSETVELGRLAEAVRRDLGEEAADLAGAFASWEGALRFFAALARVGPIVLVIDEVPYLTRSTPGLAGVIQHVWDHLAPGTGLLVALTGSAVGTMEEMLGAGAPLRGRPTESMRLDPVGLSGAVAFLPELSPDRVIEAYAACGGYPLHLSNWDQSGSTASNLQRLAGSPGSILLEDAAGMLQEELTQSHGYARILAAIGRGRTRYSQISNEAAQRIEYPLAVLERAGFVRKAIPIGAPRGASGSYEIADPYLRFWFGVIYSDLAAIEGGQGEAVLARGWPRWQTHLGGVFEEGAREHARRLVGTDELPSNILIGRWWATSGQPEEVDVLGLQGSHSYLIGEVRWQSKLLGLRDLDRLRRKIERVPRPIANPRLALWGRSGAEEAVKQAGALVYDAHDVVHGP